MSRRTHLVFAAAAVVALSPVAALGASPDRPGGAASPPAAHRGHGDLNGDRIDDVFAPALHRAADGARFDVIVTGVGLASAERAVGHVSLRYQLPIIDGFSARMTAGQARALARLPGVRRVEQVTVVRALDDGSNRDFDAINGRTAPYDDHGHGTHVMSIAAGDGVGGGSAGTFVGVAPAAALYAAK